MKLSIIATALLGSVSASPLEGRTVLESDALATKGLVNLGLYVAKHGYANPKCTLKNAVVRKEWCVLRSHHMNSV